MAQPFEYPTKPLDRGKRLDAETLKRIGEFARYRDVDGDGIPYRTVPGRRHAGVLHARLRPQREGAVQRARRRLRQQPRPARAQVRDGPDAGAEAGGRDGRQGRHRPDRLRHDALGDRRVARSAEERGGARDVVSAAARVSVHARGRASSSTGATASTWSSRIATRRCSSLLKMECTPAQFAKLRSIRHYVGLPIDGRSVTTELLKQERAIDESGDARTPRSESDARSLGPDS